MISTILLIIANLTTYAIGIWCIYLILDKKYLKRIDGLERKMTVLILANVNQAAISIKANNKTVVYDYTRRSTVANGDYIIGDKSLFDGDK